MTNISPANFIFRFVAKSTAVFRRNSNKKRNSKVISYSLFQRDSRGARAYLKHVDRPAGEAITHAQTRLSWIIKFKIRVVWPRVYYICLGIRTATVPLFPLASASPVVVARSELISRIACCRIPPENRTAIRKVILPPRVIAEVTLCEAAGSEKWTKLVNIGRERKGPSPKYARDAKEEEES